MSIPAPAGAALATPVAGTILVVDDEPAIGAIVKRILRGHDVTVVTTAQEALDILASGKTFDVILSDLMMPDQSGMDLHRELVRTAPGQADRMIFVSGGAFTPEAATFIETVPNLRLEKPFDARALRSLVETTLVRPR